MVRGSAEIVQFRFTLIACISANSNCKSLTLVECTLCEWFNFSRTQALFCRPCYVTLPAGKESAVQMALVNLSGMLILM